MQAPLIPKAFIWRRAHSLTGLWLVLFLTEHLFVNSQAALLFGDDGSGFVNAVKTIKELPYLPFIEIFLLGVPFLIHGWWGVIYLFTGESNSFKTDGSKPSLGQYSRNRAYTWQRITSWILLFGIIAHVIHMRFIEYPASARIGEDQYYMVSISRDNGLFTLSKRIGFDLYDAKRIQETKNEFSNLKSPEASSIKSPELLIEEQNIKQRKNWLQVLENFKPNDHQFVAVTKSFGVAELLMLRDTFKSPVMILLYTGLVLAACFHGFNGLWTWMITWGITLTDASQRIMRKIAVFFMVLVAFLGLAAIWGTYWINLRS